MTAAIALQLYSLREELARDFAGTLRRVATIGYTAVETAGFTGTTPAKAATVFRDLGLTVVAAHVPLPLEGKQKEVLSTLEALACTRAVCAWQPPEQFTTLAGIRATAAKLNQAAAVLAPHGISLYYHNHWFEMNPVEGRPALWHLVASLDPTVHIELDVYWAQTGGVNPVDLVTALGPRADLLHLKDGPCTMEAAMTPLGTGRVDIPAIVTAAATAGAGEWLIVELDRCETDMVTALAQSYRYLQNVLKA
jgi:sugar phosphate isomerase/epimerase